MFYRSPFPSQKPGLKTLTHNLNYNNQIQSMTLNFPKQYLKG